MTGMDDFHIFDPICNFVYFVVLSVVMSSLFVMSIVMSFMMSSCQLRSHDVGRDVVMSIVML